MSDPTRRSRILRGRGFRTCAALPCFALALAATPAHGTEAPDLAARLTASGLQALGSALPALAPSHFELSAWETELASCGFGLEATLEAPTTQVDVGWRSGAITADGGRLRVVARGDIHAKLKVRANACGLARVTCDVDVRSDDVGLDAAYAPRIADGKLRLLDPAFQVDVATSRTTIKISGCGLAGELIELAIKAFKKKVVEKGTAAIEGMGRDQIPALLEDAIGGFTDYNATLAQYRVDATLTGLDVSSANGLAAEGTLSVEPTTVAPCAAAAGTPPAAPAPTSAPALAADPADHLVLAISTRMIRDAVTAAWRGGLLCMSLDATGGDPRLLTVAAALLGLQQVDSIAVTAPTPPAVTPQPGEGARFAVQLPGLTITVEGADGDGAATISVEATLTANVVLAVDRDLGALALQVQDAKLHPSGANTTPELLTTLDAAMQALLVTQLSGVELLRQAQKLGATDAATVYLYFPRVQLEGDYVVLNGRFFEQPLADQTPPETVFDGGAPQVVAAAATFHAAGTDDHTPAELLAFSWRVDGGEWSAPSFSSRFVQSFTDGGDHVVEVVAIDLNGNRDATPASATVTVDAVAPTIAAVSTPPAEVQTAEEALLRFTVSDDRTPADQIEVRVRVVAGAGDGAVTEERPAARGVEQAAVTALKHDEVYTIEVIARDAAGNDSAPLVATFRYLGEDAKADTGAAQTTLIEGSCAVGRAPLRDGAAAWPLLLAVGLLAARRRRRPRP